MSISFAKALGVHPEALTLRTQRAEILAGNLANADTPHYQARDIDFKALLDQVQSSPAAGAADLKTTHPHHLGAAGGSHELPLLYRIPEQPSIDGNTVDVQTEQAAFMENAARYQASLTLLSSRIRGLLSALKEG
jgi:flagellar basal-body rod protein FlgB